MFSKWFTKKSDNSDIKAPEIMGLYLGGSFELDDLKLKLIEPELVIEGAARQHLIQAVGEAHIDTGGKILRYYTDDDAFLQVVLDGGDTENHITDVKLWYFYETQTVGTDNQWRDLIERQISQPHYQIENNTYSRVWNAVGDESPPVAMTEKTFELDGDTSQTDQFVMLYERQIGNESYETLLVCAEEKIVDNNHDRCLVISTGFDVLPADIKING
ncbi:YjfK family protein [Aliiglaciecola sp. 2_MG-2023]|uniref:YjfK family protein n=1 Tax=unclassified Aliiglaciecola TaxID=2593648 RepID=UPI0026E1195C|nr:MULTISPECIES: YjfK family protein [unclassified Aliiglaciecola]MDO6709970.1 YjfK family protein [Aliiglaciecola sp. 2_MG-2023]MDO6751118.1 YjfK family protein [Aliiglaciecola sp. 1_MG-2023]